MWRCLARVSAATPTLPAAPRRPLLPLRAEADTTAAVAAGEALHEPMLATRQQQQQRQGAAHGMAPSAGSPQQQQQHRHQQQPQQGGGTSWTGRPQQRDGTHVGASHGGQLLARARYHRYKQLRPPGSAVQGGRGCGLLSSFTTSGGGSGGGSSDGGGGYSRTPTASISSTPASTCDASDSGSSTNSTAFDVRQHPVLATATTGVQRTAPEDTTSGDGGESSVGGVGGVCGSGGIAKILALKVETTAPSAQDTYTMDTTKILTTTDTSWIGNETSRTDVDHNGNGNLTESGNENGNWNIDATPTQMLFTPEEVAVASQRECADVLRMCKVVRAIRNRGHFAARLDPLGRCLG